MSLSTYFPIWDKLTAAEQAILQSAAVRKSAPAGTLLNNGSSDCTGIYVVRSGQLRAYMLSDEGKEVTLYRLFARDICLFSAPCMMPGVRFEIIISAEKDTELWVIPTEAYRQVMSGSAAVANYTNELLIARFSDLMWLMEQFLWKSFDKRLAGFLLEESNIDHTDMLKTTHEKIANHMGTAREVVTRMLRYFQAEGMVNLTRGGIAITDRKKLAMLAR